MTTAPDTEELEIEHTATDRRCLVCGKTFHSSWIGERVCRRCKSSAAWREGTAE